MPFKYALFVYMGVRCCGVIFERTGKRGGSIPSKGAIRAVMVAAFLYAKKEGRLKL